MNILYKLDNDFKTSNDSFQEIGIGDEKNLLDLSSGEYQAYSRILMAINQNLKSNNNEWIKKSIEKIMGLTLKRDVTLNTLIVKSEAFSTLCSNFSSVYMPYILRISQNLTVKNPEVVYVLINYNIIFTVFENLKSSNDKIILTCLKLINNLINSSYFSRICLISSGFFQCAADFFSRVNRLSDLHYMGKLVQYMISFFFGPQNLPSLDLNNPQKMPELLIQTQQQLASNSSNQTLDMDVAMNILRTENGLNLDVRESFWNLLLIMIDKNDSYLINCGLVSLRTIAYNSKNTIFVYENTALFDKCREICSRKDPKIIENLFRLFTKFFYVIGEEANEQFIRNSLFELVVQHFVNPVESVRISAMKCISNCLCYDSNANLISSVFTNDFIIRLINSARDDNKLSFHEKDEIMWILVNLAQENQDISLLLFGEKENMELMIDFLSMSSKDIVVVELNALGCLLDSQNNRMINIDVFSLFLQSNGVEAIESLMSHQSEYIAQASQAFFEKYIDNS